MDTLEHFDPREPKPPAAPTDDEVDEAPADDDVTVGRGPGEDPRTEEPLAWDYDDKHQAP